MATRLTVNVQGSLGLDDEQRLLDELAHATGVEWRTEPVEDDGHLSGGLVEIALTVLLTKGTDVAFDAAIANVRKRLDHWRSERLDKPEYTVELETVAGDEDADDADQPEESASGG